MYLKVLRTFDWLRTGEFLIKCTWENYPLLIENECIFHVTRIVVLNIYSRRLTPCRGVWEAKEILVIHVRWHSNLYKRKTYQGKITSVSSAQCHSLTKFWYFAYTLSYFWSLVLEAFEWWRCKYIIQFRCNLFQLCLVNSTTNPNGIDNDPFVFYSSRGLWKFGVLQCRRLLTICDHDGNLNERNVIPKKFWNQIIESIEVHGKSSKAMK